MINSTFQVTFGIEIECILAFHETLLKTHLATTGADSKIIKDIPEDVRRRFNQISRHYLDEDTRQRDTSRQKYMGWGLTTPTAYPAECDNNSFQEHFEIHLSKYGYRAYGGEILHVAQALLPKEVEVHDSFHSEKRYTDFSRWHLTHDRSLVGVDKNDLMQRLNEFFKAKAPGDFDNMLKQPKRTSDWDTHPLELVSRVLPYNPASMAEVHRHLTALQEGPTHFAFPTRHCGLHVHVGLPVPKNHPAGTPPPTFTLPTLQHIAYIQVMYQNQISALHPPSRGDGTNIDLKSNLDNFYEEPEPLTDAEYDALDARIEAGEDPDAVYADQAPTFSFRKARAKIFAPDMTLQKLSELMGGNDRLRIVNWKYVARTNGSPRTLEFRQHAGTLCPTAIAHWTAFIVAVVRLAEYNSRVYGNGPDYDGEGYKCRGVGGGEEEEGGGGASVWDLMEGMELGEGEVGYWRGVVGGWGVGKGEGEGEGEGEGR